MHPTQLKNIFCTGSGSDHASEIHALSFICPSFYLVRMLHTKGGRLLNLKPTLSCFRDYWRPYVGDQRSLNLSIHGVRLSDAAFSRFILHVDAKFNVRQFEFVVKSASSFLIIIHTIIFYFKIS